MINEQTQGGPNRTQKTIVNEIQLTISQTMKEKEHETSRRFQARPGVELLFEPQRRAKNHANA
jgi:hypothetical protein